MKITITSDWHLHNYKNFSKINHEGFNTRLIDIINVGKYINQYNIKNDIWLTLLTGDLFHTFSFVENDVLNNAINLLRNWSGTFAYIPGNHDLKAKGAYTDDAVASAALQDLANVRYLNGDMIQPTADLSIYGLGWQNQEVFQNHEFPKADIFIGHQFIENSLLPGGQAVNEALKEKYKFLIFGDIHKPELQGSNVLIPGAPLQHNFGDEGQERGFWVLDTDTWTCEFIPVNISPKFITVTDVKDIKDDINYYRCRKPIKSLKDINRENVIVQEETNKREFRTTEVSADLQDEDLLLSYMKEENVTYDTAIGLDFLKNCDSKALTPSNYIITNIQLENFMSFQGAHSFDFTEGLHLFQGENGNGKTTLFEAVYYGLYGDTTKGVGADEVVNDVINSDCFVEITLKERQNELVIRRYRKHSQHKNDFVFYLDDTEVRRESIKETQAELDRVLGSSKNFFKNTCYFSQEAFEFFSTLGDSAQKTVCKNLLQIDRFEEAGHKANRELESINTRYNTIHKDIGTQEAVKHERELHLEALELSSARWQTDYNTRLATAKQTVNDSEILKPDLTAQLTDILTSLTNVKNAQNLINEKKPVVDPKFDNKIKRVEMLKDGAQEDYENSLQAPSELTALQTDLTKIKAEQSESDSRNTLFTTRIAESLESIKTYELKLQSLDSNLCPECKQNLKNTSELRGVYTKKINSYKALIEESNMAISTIPDSDTYAARIATLEEGVKQLEEKHNKQVQSAKENVEFFQANLLEAYNEKSAETNRLATEYTSKIHTYKMQQTELEAQKSVLEEKIQSVDTQIHNAKLTLNQLMEETNTYLPSIDNAKKSLADISDKIDSLAKEYEKLATDQSIMQFWSKAFSNQGIVSYLLDDFSKEFTTIINDVLLDLTQGTYTAVLSTQKKLKSGEYREKFEFLISIEGKTRSYKALSGGQKSRINLATVITLTRLVQKYYGLSGIPFGFLVLDELVSQLDPIGLECVYAELEKISKNNSVYVIAHNPELKSLFNHCIDISRDETGTHIN